MKASPVPTLGLLALAVLAPSARLRADTEGIVIDRQGKTIYYTDDRHRGGSVWAVTADGKSRPAVVAFSRHATDLALDRNGTCYGLDVGRDYRVGRLWAVGADKDTLAFFAPRTNDPLETARDWGQFVVDGAGLKVYFVYGHGIWVCGPDRRPRLLADVLKGENDGQGLRPGPPPVGGMAWGQDGHIYVIVGDELIRVTLSGEVSTFAANLYEPEPADFGRRSRPSGGGLTADARGNFYFTDVVGYRVRKITPGGRVSTVFLGKTPWWEWRANGVTVHGETLYVLEINGSPRGGFAGKDPRVRRVDSDGRSAVLATYNEPLENLPRYTFP